MDVNLRPLDWGVYGDLRVFIFAGEPSYSFWRSGLKLREKFFGFPPNLHGGRSTNRGSWRRSGLRAFSGNTFGALAGEMIAVSFVAIENGVLQKPCDDEGRYGADEG